MIRLLTILGGFALATVLLSAQTRMGANVYVQATAPSASWMTRGDLWYDTSQNTMNVLTATAPATWAALSTGGASGLPSGLIAFLASGTCPAGFTEVAGLNGRMARGTVAANGNVGTTGGSDTYTPQGSNGTPTYTGALGTLAVTAHTVVSTKQGASAGNVVTTGTHTITGVPGGTVSAPSFTGTQATVIPAYVNLIACQAN